MHTFICNVLSSTIMPYDLILLCMVTGLRFLAAAAAAAAAAARARHLLHRQAAARRPRRHLLHRQRRTGIVRVYEWRGTASQHNCKGFQWSAGSWGAHWSRWRTFARLLDANRWTRILIRLGFGVGMTHRATERHTTHVQIWPWCTSGISRVAIQIISRDTDNPSVQEFLELINSNCLLQTGATLGTRRRRSFESSASHYLLPRMMNFSLWTKVGCQKIRNAHVTQKGNTFLHGSTGVKDCPQRLL